MSAGMLALNVYAFFRLAECNHAPHCPADAAGGANEGERMSEQEIDQMEAGYEIDALIATRIFNLPRLELNGAKCPYCESEMRHCGMRSWCGGCNEWRYSPYFDYSTEIADAWQVVEKTTQDGHECCVAGDKSGWRTIIWREGYDVIMAKADAATAPLAICRAALKAIALGK